MLRLALNAHPHLAVPAETHYFPDVYEPHHDKGEAGWRHAVDVFIARCEERLQPTVPDLRRIGERCRRQAADFGALLAEPLASWASMQSKPRWGEKTPLHIFFTEEIVRLFPSAKLIALQRDPRPVVSSLNRLEHLSSDTTINAKLWYDVWTTGRSLMKRAVPEDQLLEVRYEDLVDDPEGVLAHVCAFLGEDFDPEMMNFGRSVDDFVTDLLSPQLRGPIAARETDWSSRLTADQVAIIEHVCRDPMRALGYEPVSRRPDITQRCQIALKRAYVSLKQLQHHRERYHVVGYRPFERLRRG